MRPWIFGVLALVATGLVAFVFLEHKAASPKPEKSLAVLGLANEGGDPADEYFSDGLSEELIDALARSGDLKVIARGSSLRFGSGGETSEQIGELLGVANLLEGSVHRQSGRMHIDAKLIKAADGSVLWSHSYDRDLKDVSALEQEIADAVAACLKAKPAAASKSAQVSVEAHDALLKGRFHRQHNNEAEDRKAVDEYNEAIRLDPDYALAYAERAEAFNALGDLEAKLERMPELIASALDNGQKAVAVDPELAEGHAALGWTLFLRSWKFDEGLAELERAALLSPGNATIHSQLGRTYALMGRFHEAETEARRAVESDPLQFGPRNTLARVLFFEGRLDEAVAMAKKGVALQPDAASGHRWQVFAAVLRDDGETALSEAKQEANDGFRRCFLALAYHTSGDQAAAEAALANLIATDWENFAYQVAEVYAWRGDRDAAFEWLQHAYNQRDIGILGLSSDPLMKGLHADPRYPALIERLGLPGHMP